MLNSLTLRVLSLSVLCLSLVGCSPADKPLLPGSTAITTHSSEQFAVLMGGNKVGELKVERLGNGLSIDYQYSNNGRGASSIESLQLSDKGLPIA
ncbi:hypothetical protein [Arsukibacterium sp.]|uniref:hypothetical protein n=1 Tax=Arsukibacterium sp. TaxID=1977258 RepID=UPI002FD95131